MMNMRQEVVIGRTAEAVMIPSGERVFVQQGAHATITQNLGGTYTLITERGLMVRISGKEVEAIGKTPPEATAVEAIDELTIEKMETLVWEQLKTCYDPEISVHIVALGLVFLFEMKEAEGVGSAVQTMMTLTALGR